jgi:hypothetical protein
MDYVVAFHYFYGFFSLRIRHEKFDYLQLCIGMYSSQEELTVDFSTMEDKE